MTELQKEEKRQVEKEFVVTKVQVVEDNQQRGYCKQVILATDSGKVTFKPKNFVENKRVMPNGFEVIRNETELILFEELPEILSKINEEIAMKKSCTIKAKVTEWDTIDREGKPITYTFFSSMEDFKSVELIPLE